MIFGKQTRRGVYYDLSASHYKVEQMGFTFCFSSKLHREKFKQRLPETEERFAQRMKTLYGLTFTRSIVPALYLYRLIETRGFRVIMKDDYGETLITNADKIRISLNVKGVPV